MARFTIPALVLLAVACIVVSGKQGVGKVAMFAGQHQLAAALLNDPIERGVAFYRAGLYAEADSEFKIAGRTATYNRGVTLALTGQHELSVAYFDAILFADPADQDARTNRDFVAGLIEPIIGEGTTPGRISRLAKAARQADKTAFAENLLPDQRTVLRPPGAIVITASEEWLETLSDAPGEFLKRRLQAEFDRRAAMGLIRPPEKTLW